MRGFIKANTCVACAFAGLSAGVAQAAVLVSNLAEPERDFNTISAVDWAAQSFQTDAGSYTLASIEARLGQQFFFPGGFAQLRSSDDTGAMNNSPAGVIESYVIGDATGAFAIHTLTSAGVALAPNTRYYVMFGAASLDGGGVPGYDWSYAEGNNSVGPGSFGPYEYSFDGGGTWTLFGDENPFHLQINVIPTPGATVLGALGFAAIAWRHRR